MKILFITEFYDPEAQDFTGGVEARTHFIIKHLQKHHSVEVISRSRKQITASPFSIFSRLLFQITSVFRAVTYKPDIVEGSNFVTYLPAYIAAKMTGAKAVAWWADVYGKTWFEKMSFPVAFTGYVMEWIALQCSWDGIIAMSNTTKDKLIKAGVNPKKITVVYGGVDVSVIRNQRSEISKKSTKYQILNTKYTICTAARLVNYKRVGDLIEALVLVKKEIPEAKLIIMGDGPEKKSLEQRAKILGLVVCHSDLVDLPALLRKTMQAGESLSLPQKKGSFDRLRMTGDVIFTGSIPHEKVLETMQKCHIFSLPSEVEGFGLVTVEAMACGLPYVSSDIPPTREITQEGKGGYLVKVGDVKGYAAKFIKLIKDGKDYRVKQSEGLELAQKYDWQKIVNKTESVMMDTIGTKTSS